LFFPVLLIWPVVDTPPGFDRLPETKVMILWLFRFHWEDVSVSTNLGILRLRKKSAL